MSICIVKNSMVIRNSKNLRGLLDYARIFPVVRVELTPTNNGHNGNLIVTYVDGSHGQAIFASYHIMVDWVRNRRSWRGAVVVDNGDGLGYLTKPGIIAGE